MTATPLTVDAARQLLSDHVEGLLDDDTRAAVDALLAADPALAAERRRLAQTMQLLHGLPVPEPPTDVVRQVRARLAAERRPAPRRFGGIEAAIGLAAAASVAVFIAFASQPSSSSEGTAAAGIAAAAAAVRATVVAPGLSADAVASLAAEAGMTKTATGYEGDRRAAARFLLGLKTAAAAGGSEVSGFLPDAERLVIDVRAP